MLAWIIVREEGDEGLQSPKTGFDLLVVCIEGDAEDLVEVAFLTEMVVGFVDCVGEVEEGYCCLDVASVFHETRGAWGGLRVAGANGDAIVDCLYPAGDKLEKID